MKAFKYSSGLLGICFLPLGMVTAIVLFSVLADITLPGESEVPVLDVLPELQFLLVREDSEVQERLRKKPPVPERSEQNEQWMPRLAQQMSLVEVPQASLELSLPNIEMGVSMEISPAISSLSTVDVSPMNGALDIPFRANPTAVRNVRPGYPARAKRRNIEGRVLVEFVIDEQGYVEADSITFVEVDPPGFFENEVLRALKRSRFEPLLVDAKPVASRARLPYTFSLAN